MKGNQGLGTVVIFLWMCLPTLATAEPMTGEGPNLRPRISQSEILAMELSDIQSHGRRIFTTPFNKQDGYGDGPFYRREGDPIALGNRPTLQGNGTFFRVNGLDGQTCLECHFITRNSTIPATLGVGGVAAGASHVLFVPRLIKTTRDKKNFNGRLINAPFLFGSGGVELLAKEMTMELQQFMEQALRNPGSIIRLTTKGVYFGTIVSPNGVEIDISSVEGIDPDLVVRPFGRKGEFSTVRAFDLGAMQFHFGMQPVEVTGEGVDGDGDGVEDEILIGEISALHIFATTLPRPVMDPLNAEAQDGYIIFRNIGCAVCHRPVLETENKELTYSFPEVEDDSSVNVFMMVDLAEVAYFEENRYGGLIVPLFADLKRHDMGPKLAESFYQADVQGNRGFTTARLWGVRDTAPYLHDGRATTITEAILMHGGEAQAARDRFAALPQKGKDELIAFLYSLRTPLP
jgi:hypothetical protein